LPGVDIRLQLELTGRVDIDGLRLAVRALHRVYPATNARLTSAGWWSGPRWRFDDGPESSGGVSETDGSGLGEILAQRHYWTAAPPLQLVVVRNPDADDYVVVRWPHAFMDARGAATLTEAIGRLYEELTVLPADQRQAHINGLTSAGDELRTDFGALTTTPPEHTAKAVDLARRPAGQPPVLLCEPLDPAQIGGIGLQIRKLTPGETAQVREASLRVCGMARQADFIRACGISAFHAVAPRPLPPGACYSTQQLIDNRRRRDPGPVCHNIFTALPVFVPAAIAGDRRAVADRFRDAASLALETGWMPRRLRQLRRLARVPTWMLARAMAASFRSARSWLPTGLANAPSLPLGFMGDFSRPLKRFCGAELVNVYGVRTPAIQPGIGVSVNVAMDRMNIAVSYFEARVSPETVRRFIDAYEAALLDPRI
jgi:hypothetical protein